jgi:crotonobetainyl-CoA:carnitine CoA-transferase CaiB-like acyl-CoA transferase
MVFARWGARVTRLEPTAPRDSDQASRLYLHHAKHVEQLDDLGSAAGEDRFRGHVERADIVICDLSVSRIEQLAPILQQAPVCTLITPFGRHGPRRDAPATASTLLALGGYTFLSGDPGRAPLTLPGNYPFYQAGSFAFVAALAEHLRGEMEPVTVDISVLETLATLHQFTDTMWAFDGIVRSRHGNRWENLCPTTLLPCEDGWVALNVLPGFWESFALWVGGPELVADPRFTTNDDRMAHQDELEELIIEFARDKGMEELFRSGQETWRVPIGYAPTLRGTLSDPHLVERGFWEDVPVAGGRPVLAPGSPFRVVEETEVSSVPDATPEEGVASAASSSNSSAARPLAGVRILDLTRIWSGPLATRILGDLGAEVIKIEAPHGRGPRDSGRSGMEPPPGGPDRPWNRQPLFNKLNRNKKSVAVDLKRAEGREAFLRLVGSCDVVIENFSARAMPSLGLDYDTLRKTNPGIIYAPMPALGASGPYRDYVGLGPSIEPLSGLTALMGYSEREPRVTSQAITDAAAGVTAAVEVMTALWRRQETRRGALLDLSQGEAMSAYLGEFFIREQLGQSPARIGNAHAEFAPHGVYRCSGDDEWIAIAVTGEDEWTAFAALADRGWGEEPGFQTREDRRANAAALDREIEEWTAGLDKAVLEGALLERGIAAGAVLSAPELQQDATLVGRSYFAELSTPDTGLHRYDGSPIEVDGSRDYEWWRGAPGLGEHNREVLLSAGYDDAEIDALYEAGVVVDGPPE